MIKTEYSSKPVKLIINNSQIKRHFLGNTELNIDEEVRRITYSDHSLIKRILKEKKSQSLMA